MNRRMLCVVALGSFLSACGGSSSDSNKMKYSYKDPDSVAFDFTGTAETGNSPASGIMPQLLTMWGTMQEPQGEMDDLQLALYSLLYPAELSIYTFQDPIMDVDFSLAPTNVLRHAQARTLKIAAAKLAADSSGDESYNLGLDADCTFTATQTDITFDNCKVSYANDQGELNAVSGVIDGSLHHSAGDIHWDLMIQVTGAGNMTMPDDVEYALTGSAELRLQGALTIASGTYDGTIRMDEGIDLKGTPAGGTEETLLNEVLSHKLALSGLQWVTDDNGTPADTSDDSQCVGNGKLTMKHVYTALPSGSLLPSDAEYTDAAYEFDWTVASGDTCGTPTFVKGTLPQ